MDAALGEHQQKGAGGVSGAGHLDAHLHRSQTARIGGLETPGWWDSGWEESQRLLGWKMSF